MKKQILIDKHTSMFEQVKTSQKPGVLATIRGAVSGWKPNRNGRTYSRELWQKAINSEFVKEQIALKHFIGEADHPEDRLDPAFEHMSHAVSDFEFHDDTSELWATIDILDTPDGHKLKTLLDYSGSLSFSTRGSGDVMENGEVDPDTYQLFAVDSVIRPSYPTATVLAESQKFKTTKTITEGEALKVLEAYSGSKYNKKVSLSSADFRDELFKLNHRSLMLEESSNYTNDDLNYVIDLVDTYRDKDEDVIYDIVKDMLKDTKLADNDDIIWDAMAYVLDGSITENEDNEQSYADLVCDYYFNNKLFNTSKGIDEVCKKLGCNYEQDFGEIDRLRKWIYSMDEDELRAYFPYLDESQNLKEFFGKKKKEQPQSGKGGDPSKCDAIEATLITWFEDNTEDIMDRDVTCEANSEGFSYVITVKSFYISRYNLFDEYDVMDYADEAGQYIADRLKIEYVYSKKVNDRTFKIYLDNYYTV